MKIFGFLSREERDERRILSGKVLGALFALVGAIIFVYGYYQRSMANKSMSWSTIEGMIISSKVVKAKNSDDEITYRPLIKYKYAVDGVIYRSDRIFFGDMSEQTSSKLPMSCVKQFPANSKIKVFYNPYSPTESVLISGETRYAGQTMIFAAIIFMSGVLITIQSFWKERQYELDKI